MTDLYDPLGTGLVASVAGGPILGDPEPCIRIGSGGSLTTGTLAVGDPEDMGLLANFTVELWVQFESAVPGVTETIWKGPQATIGPTNYQWYLTVDSDGSLNFNVINAGSTIRTASSTSGLIAGQWYHVVGQARSGHLYIYVNGVQWADSASWGADTVHPIAGTPSLDIIGGTTARLFADAAVYRTGLSESRIQAHYTAGSARGFGQQTTGVRINAVLDSVGSNAPRQIGTSARSLLSRFMAGETPISAISEAVAAEAIDAVFFVKADGTLVFLGSAHRSSSPYNTVQATFGDAGGSELPYLEVNVDYSDSFLVNEWNVTRTGTDKVPGTTVTLTDATSIGRYFKRTQSIGGLALVSDSDSTTIATAMLAKYKDPMQRVTALVMNTVDSSVSEAVFRRELMDKITVKRTPPGGGSRISQDLFIQKIEVTGANDGNPWSISWGVSPL